MQKTVKRNCPRCGKDFKVIQNHSRMYCSSECRYAHKRDKETALNRRFTDDTPFLAWLWHYRDKWSFRKIGEVMGRSSENVKKAVEVYQREYEDQERGRQVRNKIAGMVIADNLKKYRKEAGVTQEEAARYLGVCKRAYIKHESGQSKPNLDYLLKLAKLYGVGVEKLIEGV